MNDDDENDNSCTPTGKQKCRGTFPGSLPLANRIQSKDERQALTARSKLVHISFDASLVKRDDTPRRVTPARELMEKKGITPTRGWRRERGEPQRGTNPTQLRAVMRASNYVIRS